MVRKKNKQQLDREVSPFQVSLDNLAVYTQRGAVLNLSSIGQRLASIPRAGYFQDMVNLAMLVSLIDILCEDASVQCTLFRFLMKMKMMEEMPTRPSP